MDKVEVKLIIDDKVYRTVVMPATFERLSLCVNKTYWASRPASLVESKQLTCFYVDSEGERVVLYDDEQFQAARTLAAGKTPRVYVEATDVPGGAGVSRTSTSPPRGTSLSFGADLPASVFFVRFTVHEQLNVRAHVAQAARELRIGGNAQRTSPTTVVVTAATAQQAAMAHFCGQVTDMFPRGSVPRAYVIKSSDAQHISMSIRIFTVTKTAASTRADGRSLSDDPDDAVSSRGF